LDELTARAVGLLCVRSGHSDVVDVQVALHAWQHSHHVVTSDPDDLRSIAPALRLIVV
jgi:predicted nucleic acid-binding protein